MKLLKSDESGLVSIAVTIIISALLTVLVLGFAGLANREYRQALDQQLNTQAFYAAESGINDAIASKPVDCDSTPNPLTVNSNSFITCVSYDDTPKALEYDEVGTNSSTIIPIENSQTPIESVTINWQQKDGSTQFAPNCDGRLLSASEWGNRTPAMTAMLIPQSFDDQDDLANKTQKTILYPCNSPTGTLAATTNFAEQGKYGYAKCSNTNIPKFCSLKITGLSALTDSGPNFVLRFRSIYSTASVTITAQDSSGNDLPLSNAQRVIDSTGKASDILRRLKVRVPIVNPSIKNIPEFALEATDGVCKRMLVTSGVGVAVGAADSTNPNCAVPAATSFATGNPGGNSVLIGSAAISGFGAGVKPVWSKNLANYYDFSGAWKNISNLSAANAGTLVRCTWFFGDGSSQTFNATDLPCQNKGNNAVINHTFPDVRGLINRTNGVQGCNNYYLTLVNEFSTGIKTPSAQVRAQVPLGIANDDPWFTDPITKAKTINDQTGVGICFGKWKDVPANTVVNPDPNPAAVSKYWSTFPVPYPSNPPPYPN